MFPNVRAAIAMMEAMPLKDLPEGTVLKFALPEGSGVFQNGVGNGPNLPKTDYEKPHCIFFNRNRDSFTVVHREVSHLLFYYLNDGRGKTVGNATFVSRGPGPFSDRWAIANEDDVNFYGKPVSRITLAEAKRVGTLSQDYWQLQFTSSIPGDDFLGCTAGIDPHNPSPELGVGPTLGTLIHSFGHYLVSIEFPK